MKFPGDFIMRSGHIRLYQSAPAPGSSVKPKSVQSSVLTSPLTQWQRALGNQAYGQFLQAKLTISQPGDRYEQEADRVADQVMRMTDRKVSGLSDGPATIQRTCATCTSGQGICPKCTSEIELQRKPLASNITPLIQRQREKADEEEEEEEKLLQTKEMPGQTPQVTPQIANSINALQGGGQPLTKSIRNHFEPRFGADFHRVRVYTDSTAAKTAESINAVAYTVGQNIAFGRGHYAPETIQGKRLLAHELTHTLQQRSNGRVIFRNVQPATAADRREFVQEAILWLNNAASFYRLMTVDQDRLRRTLDGLKSTVENNLPIINNFLQGNAALKGQLRQAYQNAVSALVRRASQQLNQTTHEIYQPNRSRIHEWGWPQATQDTAAHSRTAALPEAERRRIRVIVTDFNLSNLHDLFSTQGGKTTIGLPQGVTVSFVGTIPQGLRHGLQNVAGELVPAPLALNSTITLALDLERYGRDYGAYRYTYVEHRPREGARTREVIIEQLGSVGIEGLTEAQRRAQVQRFRQHGFTRGRRWSTEQFEALLTAIAQVPDRMLTPVRGLTFNRATAHATEPNVGGDYDPDTHTITLYDRSFLASLTRFGTPGTTSGISTNAVRSIVHEIGHAIDLLPLRRAWRTLEQSQQALHTAFQQFENPPGSRSYRFPNTEQARYDRLNRQITQARQARTRARSPSGSRWRQRAGAWEIAETSRAAGSNAFRQAARQDGARSPTNYPNPNPWWQEYFAESFFLYITSPTVLRQQRPNVHTYFVANFPR